MCVHHSCLLCCEDRVQALVGLVIKVLKYLRRKDCFYIDVSKWLAFRVFSDKDVNTGYLGSTIIKFSVIGSPINWAIACLVNPFTEHNESIKFEPIKRSIGVYSNLDVQCSTNRCSNVLLMLLFFRLAMQVLKM